MSRADLDGRRRDRLNRWQARWSDSSYRPHWMNRGISPEIGDAVESGWFPAGAPALDIGCGEGEVTAWMAKCGFPSVGVDIAPAAVARARARFGETPGSLEFFVADVSDRPLPDRGFRILIDRGCFHHIPKPDQADFLHNLLRASAPDARLLLFCRAFRDGIPIGDPDERRRITAGVEEGLGHGFRLVRSADTYLDPNAGQTPDTAKGGMVFWLERQ